MQASTTPALSDPLQLHNTASIPLLPQAMDTQDGTTPAAIDMRPRDALQSQDAAEFMSFQQTYMSEEDRGLLQDYYHELAQESAISLQAMEDGKLDILFTSVRAQSLRVENETPVATDTLEARLTKRGDFGTFLRSLEHTSRLLTECHNRVQTALATIEDDNSELNPALLLVRRAYNRIRSREAHLQAPGAVISFVHAIIYLSDTILLENAVQAYLETLKSGVQAPSEDT